MNYNKLLSKENHKLKKFLENPLTNIPTLSDAIEISKTYNVDLHPKYIYYWNELSSTELISFLEFLTTNSRFDKSKLILPISEEKRSFEVLGIEHIILKDNFIIDEPQTNILLANLGCTQEDFIKQIQKIIDYAKSNLTQKSNVILSSCNEIGIRDKGGTYIGARMGRPEKSKMRKKFNDETRSQSLFPLGEKGGRSKNLIEAFTNDKPIEENFRIYLCKKCNRESPFSTCEICNSKTEQQEQKQFNKETLYKKTQIDLHPIKKQVQEIMGEDYSGLKSVKGITQTINKHHTTEHPIKGFLRAKNNVFVNKDGTIRYDMLEMGLTHFRAKEIGTSIAKLKELGYTNDINNKPLTNDEQLIEILPQDVILPDCKESGDELASDYIINTANFVDDLLEKFYDLKRFYNFETKEDTIGHLIIGLAPHTSAGILGRIIGYSKTQGCFSHPVWHAAQRRNLDGDENGIMLLMDGLINFSREYLPDRRGTRTMDVSLVLTSHLHLDQIDDEVHGLDIASYYPLELYEAAKEYKSPKEISIEQINSRLNEENIDNRYLGYSFTNDTDNFNDTILCSAYKFLPMMDKLNQSLELGTRIRAVDENKVATMVIEKHFLKDIKGNLRRFGAQTFRCTSCNTIYRRVPLNGLCTNCKKSSINFTVHEGSIKKYLKPSLELIKKYDVDPYIKEVLELTELRIKELFGEEDIESEEE